MNLLDHHPGVSERSQAMSACSAPRASHLRRATSLDSRARANFVANPEGDGVEIVPSIQRKNSSWV